METTGNEVERVRVVCTDPNCLFSEVVGNDDGEASDVIVRHGRETGHTLRTEDVT